jgi:hypothetical protein
MNPAQKQNDECITLIVYSLKMIVNQYSRRDADTEF